MGAARKSELIAPLPSVNPAFTREPELAMASVSGNFVGRYAVCSMGVIGRIEGYKKLPWGWSWVGTAINGKQWASRKPVLLAVEMEKHLLAMAVQ